MASQQKKSLGSETIKHDSLKTSGLRLTRQRQALADLLFDGVDKHMTAEQIHDAMRQRRVSISLATIYNTLHQFTKAGLLREIVIDSSRVYFDTNTDVHHHFFDEKASQLTDIPAHAVTIARLPTSPLGSEIDSVDVIIRLRSKS